MGASSLGRCPGTPPPGSAGGNPSPFCPREPSGGHTAQLQACVPWAPEPEMRSFIQQKLSWDLSLERYDHGFIIITQELDLPTCFRQKQSLIQTVSLTVVSPSVSTQAIFDRQWQKTGLAASLPLHIQSTPLDPHTARALDRRGSG